MRFESFILERSFTMEDIPKKFFVAFDFKDAYKGLKEGEFYGMSGISGSGNIKFNFLGVARDAMLVMDSKKVIDLNNLTRIMYNNPHYLVSNDMDALKRIFSARDNTRVLENILQYIEKELKGSKHKQLFYDATYYSLFNMGWDWSKVLPKIKNIKSLTTFLTRKINTDFSKKTGADYNIKEKEVNELLWNALLKIGEVYSDESEWVIKNKTFKIPSDSKLFVLIGSFDRLNDLIDYCIDNNKQFDSLKDEEKEKYIKGDDSVYLFMKEDAIQKRIDYGIMIKNLEKKYNVYPYDRIKFENAKKRFFKRR